MTGKENPNMNQDVCIFLLKNEIFQLVMLFFRQGVVTQHKNQRIHSLFTQVLDYAPKVSGHPLPVESLKGMIHHRIPDFLLGLLVLLQDSVKLKKKRMWILLRFYWWYPPPDGRSYWFRTTGHHRFTWFFFLCGAANGREKSQPQRRGFLLLVFGPSGAWAWKLWLGIWSTHRMHGFM